jgi:hypothetical protein
MQNEMGENTTPLVAIDYTPHLRLLLEALNNQPVFEIQPNALTLRVAGIATAVVRLASERKNAPRSKPLAAPFAYTIGTTTATVHHEDEQAVHSFGRLIEQLRTVLLTKANDALAASTLTSTSLSEYVMGITTPMQQLSSEKPAGLLSDNEQCRKNAQAKSEQKRQATFAAIRELQQGKHPITRSAVARRAGVSVVFLRSHPDLLQALEEAEQRYRLAPPESSADKAKDQVIAALRRRLDEMKQQLTAKDQALRGKQREMDLLYGKLASASPLTDAELRRALAEALQRLAAQGLVSETSAG